MSHSMVFTESLESRTLFTGTWTPLVNPVPSPNGTGTMLLLSDGTVMVNGGGGYATGPTGNAQWGQAPGTNHPPGALLGKIGNGGQTFLIGENYKGPAKAEGKRAQ